MELAAEAVPVGDTKRQRSGATSLPRTAREADGGFPERPASPACPSAVEWLELGQHRVALRRPDHWRGCLRGWLL